MWLKEKLQKFVERLSTIDKDDFVLAVIDGDEERLKAMIDGGVDLNKMVNGTSRIDFALLVGNESCASYCLQNWKSRNAHEELALLHKVVYKDNVTSARLLVERGVDMMAPDKKHRINAIHAAAFAGSIRCLDYFAGQGADLDAKEGKHGMTALHFAWGQDKKEVVIRLLELGADITIKDNLGRDAFNDNPDSKLILDAYLENKKLNESIQDDNNQLNDLHF